MQIVPLSAFRDNYIWALCAQGQCVIVDPGEAAPVLRFLAEQQLHLAAILITHRHNDHVGGVAELCAATPVPVYGPASISQVTHAVCEGDAVSLTEIGITAHVMEVPGHTEEHIAYRVTTQDGAHLFCGDTLFAGGCGRILGSSTAAQFHASLQRIAALPAETLIYCAHEYTLSNLKFAQALEPDNVALLARVESCQHLREQGTPTVPSRLSDELATNPFLRTGQHTIRGALMRQTHTAFSEGSAVFAALRAWKDVF